MWARLPGVQRYAGEPGTTVRTKIPAVLFWQRRNVNESTTGISNWQWGCTGNQAACMAGGWYVWKVGPVQRRSWNPVRNETKSAQRQGEANPRRRSRVIHHSHVPYANCMGPGEPNASRCVNCNRDARTNARVTLGTVEGGERWLSNQRYKVAAGA